MPLGGLRLCLMGLWRPCVDSWRLGPADRITPVRLQHMHFHITPLILLTQMAKPINYCHGKFKFIHLSQIRVSVSGDELLCPSHWFVPKVTHYTPFMSLQNTNTKLKIWRFSFPFKVFWNNKHKYSAVLKYWFHCKFLPSFTYRVCVCVHTCTCLHVYICLSAHVCVGEGGGVHVCACTCAYLQYW